MRYYFSDSIIILAECMPKKSAKSFHPTHVPLLFKSIIKNYTYVLTYYDDKILKHN